MNDQSKTAIGWRIVVLVSRKKKRKKHYLVTEEEAGRSATYLNNRREDRPRLQHGKSFQLRGSSQQFRSPQVGGAQLKQYLSTKARKQMFECFNCHRRGHYARDCWAKRQAEGNLVTSNNSQTEDKRSEEWDAEVVIEDEKAHGKPRRKEHKLQFQNRKCSTMIKTGLLILVAPII
jgi:hypothetical protein